MHLKIAGLIVGFVLFVGGILFATDYGETNRLPRVIQIDQDMVGKVEMADESIILHCRDDRTPELEFCIVVVNGLRYELGGRALCPSVDVMRGETYEVKTFKTEPAP